MLLCARRAAGNGPRPSQQACAGAMRAHAASATCLAEPARSTGAQADSTRAGAGGPAPHKRSETRPGRRTGAPASGCSAGSSASWACTRAGGWRARRSATSRSAARARTASRPRCAWTGARSSRTSTASGRRTPRVRAAEYIGLGRVGYPLYAGTAASAAPAAAPARRAGWGAPRC